MNRSPYLLITLSFQLIHQKDLTRARAIIPCSSLAVPMVHSVCYNYAR